jgi:DNA-binding MarR family transcriptional regulator
VKEYILQLNKIFENRYRLGIMSLLMIHESLDFNSMKLDLDITDGNLASHMAALENAGYVQVKKETEGSRSITSYSATLEGRKAFSTHLDMLEKILKNIQ